MKTETQIRSEIEELEKIKTNLDNHTEVHEALIKKKSELKGYLLAKKEMIDDEIRFLKEQLDNLECLKKNINNFTNDGQADIWQDFEECYYSMINRLSDLKEVQKND